MSLNFIIDVSDTDTVKLDLDHTSFSRVKEIAIKPLKWFKLEGFIILKSSENNYLVVFNRKVTWSENLSIVAWVCLVARNKLLLKWFLIQYIKQSSTLRISQNLHQE